jgi:endonuclease/exonuclease/phosphatase (EEP) superfamily protein YafD
VTFLPRLPWLLPGALLLAASLLARSKVFWINLATALFVLLAITQFNVPWQNLSEPESSETRNEGTLRIVSCNVQTFTPDFSVVLREIQRAKPDLVALQEASRPPRLLLDYFEGWHQVQVRGLWVASKWPLRLLGGGIGAAW